MELADELEQHVVYLRVLLHEFEASLGAQLRCERRELVAKREGFHILVERRSLARGVARGEPRPERRERAHELHARSFRGLRRVLRERLGERDAAAAAREHVVFERLRLLPADEREPGFGRGEHLRSRKFARGRGERGAREPRRGVDRERPLRVREKRDAPRAQRAAHGLEVKLHVGRDDRHVAVAHARVRRGERGVGGGLGLRAHVGAREQADRAARRSRKRRVRIGEALALEVGKRGSLCFRFRDRGAPARQTHDADRTLLAGGDGLYAFAHALLRGEHARVASGRIGVGAQRDGHVRANVHERRDDVEKLLAHQVEPVYDDLGPAHARLREPLAEREERVLRVHPASSEVFLIRAVEAREIGELFLERRALGELFRRLRELLRVDVEALAQREEFVARLAEAGTVAHAREGDERVGKILGALAYDHPSPLPGEEHAPLAGFPKDPFGERREGADVYVDEAPELRAQRALGFKRELLGHDVVGAPTRGRDFCRAAVQIRAFARAGAADDERDVGSHQKLSLCSAR